MALPCSTCGHELEDGDPALWCPECQHPLERGRDQRVARHQQYWGATGTDATSIAVDKDPTGDVVLDEPVAGEATEATVVTPVVAGPPPPPAPPPAPPEPAPAAPSHHGPSRRLVYLAAGIVVVLLLGIAAFVATRGDDGTAVVATQGVNVRSEPQQVAGNERGVLQGGEEVRIACRERQIWGRIASGEFEGGFVSLNFVRLADGGGSISEAIPEC